MEKLEGILHAEETARHVVADARTRTRDIKGEALAEAERITANIEQETTEEITTLRDKILQDADVQVVSIEDDVAGRLIEVIRVAETRIGTATDRVIDKLVG